jgi:hypothetical protein
MIAGRQVEITLADAWVGQADYRVIPTIAIADRDGREPQRNAEIEYLEAVSGIECVRDD